MAKKSSDMFEVTCPCCAAVLKVDAATEAVIAHTPAPTKRMFNDMEEAAKAMHQQDDRRDSPSTRRLLFPPREPHARMLRPPTHTVG